MTTPKEPAKKRAPNGGKGRPPGIKNRKEAKRSFCVDTFRATQPAEWVADFDRWVSSFRPTITDIHNRLKEEGYTHGWGSVRSWYAFCYPAGTEAERINAAAAVNAGIDPHAMMETALVNVVSTLNRAQQRLGELTTLEGMDIGDVAKLVAPLAKEVRTTAAKIQEFQVVRDVREQEMAGAVFVIEHIYQTFDDNPAILEPVKAACRAALAKLEGE